MDGGWRGGRGVSERHEETQKSLDMLHDANFIKKNIPVNRVSLQDNRFDYFMSKGISFF